MSYYEKEYNFVRGILNNANEEEKTRHILVFINVLSGNGAAIKVFIQAAIPYFSIASITYDIVAVTSMTCGLPVSAEVLQGVLKCRSLIVLSGRISDYIQSMETDDMDKYDAFVVVGGDGTLGELATGCTLFAQRLKEDVFKYPSILPDTELKPFLKPIGIIPAGSTDAVACTLFGSRDPHLAAITIALGVSKYMDIQAVFADGHFSKISLATVCCGFLTETLIRMKRFAKYGQIKSILAGIFAFIRFKPYHITIEYRPRDVCKLPTDIPCSFKCRICEEWNKFSCPKNSSLSSKSDWRWVSAESSPFSYLNAYASPLRVPGALRLGVAPLCHLCDGTAQIFAISHSGGRLRLMIGLISAFIGCIGAIYYRKLPAIVKVLAIRSCCEYRFTVKSVLFNEENVEGGSLEGSVSWNVDGEVIVAHSIHAVVHSKLLKFFATGGPLPSPNVFTSLWLDRRIKALLPSLILETVPSSITLRNNRDDGVTKKFIRSRWKKCATFLNRRFVVVLLIFIVLLVVIIKTGSSNMRTAALFLSTFRREATETYLLPHVA